MQTHCFRLRSRCAPRRIPHRRRFPSEPRTYGLKGGTAIAPGFAAVGSTPDFTCRPAALLSDLVVGAFGAYPPAKVVVVADSDCILPSASSTLLEVPSDLLSSAGPPRSGACGIQAGGVEALALSRSTAASAARFKAHLIPPQCKFSAKPDAITPFLYGRASEARPPVVAPVAPPASPRPAADAGEYPKLRAALASASDKSAGRVAPSAASGASVSLTDGASDPWPVRACRAILKGTGVAYQGFTVASATSALTFLMVTCLLLDPAAPDCIVIGDKSGKLATALLRRGFKPLIVEPQGTDLPCLSYKGFAEDTMFSKRWRAAYISWRLATMMRCAGANISRRRLPSTRSIGLSISPSYAGACRPTPFSSSTPSRSSTSSGARFTKRSTLSGSVQTTRATPRGSAHTSWCVASSTLSPRTSSLRLILTTSTRVAVHGKVAELD